MWLWRALVGFFFFFSFILFGFAELLGSVSLWFSSNLESFFVITSSNIFLLPLYFSLRKFNVVQFYIALQVNQCALFIYFFFLWFHLVSFYCCAFKPPNLFFQIWHAFNLVNYLFQMLFSSDNVLYIPFLVWLCSCFPLTSWITL